MQMDIPNPSPPNHNTSEAHALPHSEPHVASARTDAEIRRFNAMLRAGGINPDGVGGRCLVRPAAVLP